MENDFLRDAGVKVLGTRLRRLFERLNGNVTELYRRELGFEQRWFALGMLLNERGPIDSGQAASLLGQSHVAIVQVVKAMVKAELIERRSHSEDRRRKILHLTPFGISQIAKANAISRTVQLAAEGLLDEAAPGFMEALDALDDALEKQNFASRIESKINGKSNDNALASTNS